MEYQDESLDHGTRKKFGALETIRTLTPGYAQAKADRTHIELYRKSMKALLMMEAEADHGIKSAAMQERYAYAHEKYVAMLDGLRVAVEAEERLRWQIEAAKLACSIWQTKQANARVERQAIP